MKVDCGEGAAESFSVLASGFPAPGEAVPAGAAFVRGSKVAKGSRRVVESGLPRRRRGRFASSIGSLGAEAFAVFVSDVAGGAGGGAVAGGGGGGGGRGGC